MINFADASLNTLIAKGGHDCACGRHHEMKMDYLAIEPGAVRHIPEALKAIGCTKPFIVCDVNTKKAAWSFVEPVLKQAGIEYTLYCFPFEHVEPDEYAMGSLVMHYDVTCDGVMGIGSGVVNDCCKVLSHKVGVGTLLTLKLYEQIRKMHPDRKVAEDFIKSFTDEQWQAMIRDIFGKAAETVILQEHTVFHKNDPARHAKRLDKIIAHWDDILRIIDEELPSCESIAAMMRDLGMPTQPEDINVTWQDTEKAFIGSRDIRDKYLSSSMLWDMGLLYTTKLQRG